MKFKEFLKEENQTPFEKFIDQYSVDAYDDNYHLISTVDDLLNADKSGINSNIILLSLDVNKSAPVKFDPPVGPNDWKNLEQFGLVGGQRSPEPHVIEDFTKMPDVRTLSVSRVEVKSLKGITNLKRLKTLEIYTASFDCGLVSLLKAPNLNSIILDNYVGDDDLHEALSIISAHLDSRDIAECMDALMEKGLKKYAKL
jgi:hypothetical protein